MRHWTRHFGIDIWNAGLRGTVIDRSEVRDGYTHFSGHFSGVVGASLCTQVFVVCLAARLGTKVLATAHVARTYRLAGSNHPWDEVAQWKLAEGSVGIGRSILGGSSQPRLMGMHGIWQYSLYDYYAFATI